MMWKIIITIILAAVDICFTEYEKKKGQNDNDN